MRHVHQVSLQAELKQIRVTEAAIDMHTLITANHIGQHEQIMARIC